MDTHTNTHANITDESYMPLHNNNHDKIFPVTGSGS